MTIPSTPFAPPDDPQKLLAFIENIKKQWLATIDALVDPIIMIDRNYKILKSNVAFAKFAKLGVKDVLGKSCFELMANRKTPCEGCELQRTFQESSIQKFQIQEAQDFDVTSQPLLNEKKTVDSVVHIYRDRTAAAQLQRQLIQNEKLTSLGLLAGGVAHEINNPLGGIMIFAQMLLREMPKESPHYLDVQEIEVAAQRCKVIVEKLLSFARKKTSKKSDLEIFDGNDAAREALKFINVHHKIHSVNVTENLESKMMIRGEQNDLIQVFLNLLHNALQATDSGGEIKFTSSIHHNFGVWEIRDTGCGISKANLSKIFDPFFTTKSPQEGTGLGLSIALSICTSFGGTLEAESQVGVGSLFRVKLPLVSS